MKTINITLEIYTLSELSIISKRKAIEEQREFLLSAHYYNDDYVLTEEEDCTDTYIIDSIDMNNYKYDEDGNMLNTVYYCGDHPRSGEEVLTINNKEYIIN